MPVPTNLTPDTAILITALPYSATLDAFEVPNESLWFRYDKTAGGYTALGLASPLPSSTGTYVPRVNVYTGTPSALVPYLDILAINVPFGMPLDEVIVSYFFEVRRAGGTAPFTERLQFDLLPGPVAAAPPGSIVVNDDQQGFPISIVDSATGDVLQQFPFPVGERVGMLPSGVMLWHDQINRRSELYSATFTHLATVTWSVMADHTDTPEVPITASDTQFYMADRGVVSPPRNAQVIAVSAAGVLGPTVWNLGAYYVQSLAVSRDDAILYYVRDTGVGLGAIKRWDLVGNVPLSDLVPGEASYRSGKDLFVLADGTLLTFYKGTASFVRHYSAAGVTLHTYPFATGDLNRITPGLDGASFWVWQFFDGGATARFTLVRLSDGAVLQTVDSPVQSGGVWLGPSGAPGAAVAVSCPFTLLPPPGLPPLEFPPPPVPTPTPTWGVRELPQRRLRRATHIADEQRWMFHNRFQIDLQTGIGLVAGQGADPQLMIRWSNDGGHTWSNEHWVSAGRIGARRTRALVRQTGRARTRTYEVVVSDPVPWYLAAAYLDISPGNGT